MYKSRKLSLLIVAAFNILVCEECYGKTDYQAKLSIGFIKANKYQDYTSGKLDDINEAPSKNGIISGVEFIIKPNNSVKLGGSIEYSTHKFSNSHPADDGMFTKEELKIKSLTYMCNGYYDFYNAKNLMSYLIMGAGIAVNKSGDFVQIIPFDDNFTVRFPGATRANFAWQIGTGIQTSINDHILLDTSIKYFDYGKTSTKSIAYTSMGKTYNNLGFIGTKLRGGIISVGLVINF